MNSRIYIPMVFYHNYVWYCCHLRWGIWSDLNKSWFSDHEVKKIDKWLIIALSIFLIAVSLHMNAHIFVKCRSFQTLLLSIISAGCGLFWQRESLVLSDSCQWYIQSVCVFRQVLLQWRWVSGLVPYITGGGGMTECIIDKFIQHIIDLLKYTLICDDVAW